MSWLEDEVTEPVVAASEGAERANQLYPGDVGALPLDARRALCQLLSGPSIDAGRHGQLWPALLRHEPVLRARLADLFLELVIDAEAGVAFTRQADTGELGTPVLLRSAPLTFIDSVLLLHLRQQLAEADAHGNRAVVEEGALVDVLSVYEKNLSTDRAGFARRVSAAIVKMKEPIPLVEHIWDAQFRFGQDFDRIMMMKMENIYSPDVYRLIMSHKEFSLSKDLRSTGDLGQHAARGDEPR